MTLQQFCLRWNNHQPNFISVFTNLLNNEALVDVTLAAEGQHLQAHRVVLSACSSYFQTLFTVNPCQHPIVILKDVSFSDLKIMVDFMYYGEVNVTQEQLPAILKTAEMLKIKGLTEMPDHSSTLGAFRFSKSSSMSLDKADFATSVDSHRSQSPVSPAIRRKRLRKSSTGSGSGSTGERTSQETLSEITIVPCDNPATIKMELVRNTTSGNSRPQQHATPHSLKGSRQEPSTDSEQRVGSQESVDEDVSSLHGSQDSSTGAGDGSVSVVDTGPYPSSSQQTSGQAGKMGKHRRLLTRQPRIKKESEPLHTSPDNSEPPQSPHFAAAVTTTAASHQPSIVMSVPPVHIEASSESLASHTPRIPAHNLLSVPQPSYLVKQHSHPLLPSQKSTHTSVHRQMSTPTPGTSCNPLPPLQVHFVASVQPKEYTLRVASPPTEARHPADLSTELGGNFTSGPRSSRDNELRRASSSPQVLSPRDGYEPRSVHCPMLRPGPALGCNFCWNTIDTHGRILRRKTKYHCPECQTNLCIVPCFQEYHERNAPGSSRDTTEAISSTAVKTLLPKTSSI